MYLGEQPEKLRHTIIKRFYKTSDIVEEIDENEPFDYIENGDIMNQVQKLLKLFGIQSDDLRVDTSYVVNFIKLNKDSLENDDYSNLIEPEFKNYKVPYWVVETVVYRREYYVNIESYGNPDDAAEIFKEIEYDGAMSLFDGTETSSDSIDGSFDDWGIHKNRITEN